MRMFCRTLEADSKRLAFAIEITTERVSPATVRERACRQPLAWMAFPPALTKVSVIGWTPDGRHACVLSHGRSVWDRFRL